MRRRTVIRFCSAGAVILTTLAGCASTSASPGTPADLQSVLQRAERDNWGVRVTMADGSSALGRVAAVDGSAVTVGDRRIGLAEVIRVERERDRSGPLLIGIVGGTLAGLAGGQLYSAVTDVSPSSTALVAAGLIGLGIGALVAGRSNVEWETVWAESDLRREVPDSLRDQDTPGGQKGIFLTEIGHY